MSTEPISGVQRGEKKEKGKRLMRRWCERARAESEEVNRKASRWDGSKD